MIIVPVGLLIFVGHFADVYLLVIPGTMFDHNEFGIFEVGLFLGFFGLYMKQHLECAEQGPVDSLSITRCCKSRRIYIIDLIDTFLRS